MRITWDINAQEKAMPGFVQITDVDLVSDTRAEKDKERISARPCLIGDLALLRYDVPVKKVCHHK